MDSEWNSLSLTNNLTSDHDDHLGPQESPGYATPARDRREGHRDVGVGGYLDI